MSEILLLKGYVPNLEEGIVGMRYLIAEQEMLDLENHSQGLLADLEIDEENVQTTLTTHTNEELGVNSLARFIKDVLQYHGHAVTEDEKIKIMSAKDNVFDFPGADTDGIEIGEQIISAS
jgi:hypothetical protein